MSDFKVPGGEVSSVSIDPRLQLDDEVTEVTKTAGPPVDVGQAINRQFAEDGAPAIKGGDSSWVAGDGQATKGSRELKATAQAEHDQKYMKKMKLRKAQMDDLIKRRKAESKEAFQQRMAATRAANARVMARAADTAKRNDRVKAALRDNAKASDRTQENLRMSGGSSAPTTAAAAPEDSPAPVSTGPAPAGPDVEHAADPSSK